MGSDAPMGKAPRERGILSLVTDLTPEQMRSLKICVAYATASITISMIYKVRAHCVGDALGAWRFASCAGRNATAGEARCCTLCD